MTRRLNRNALARCTAVAVWLLGAASAHANAAIATPATAPAQRTASAQKPASGAGAAATAAKTASAKARQALADAQTDPTGPVATRPQASQPTGTGAVRSAATAAQAQASAAAAAAPAAPAAQAAAPVQAQRVAEAAATSAKAQSPAPGVAGPQGPGAPSPRILVGVLLTDGKPARGLLGDMAAPLEIGQVIDGSDAESAVRVVAVDAGGVTLRHGSVDMRRPIGSDLSAPSLLRSAGAQPKTPPASSPKR